MNGNYFVDTNVLIYCYTVTEPDKQLKAQQVVMLTGRIISTQVLQELANTLRRKFNKEWSEIKATLDEVNQQFTVHVNSAETVNSAIQLADRYRYTLYDSLIIAAALESGCSVLYSEDMQANQVISDRLTIRNPFN